MAPDDRYLRHPKSYLADTGRPLDVTKWQDGSDTAHPARVASCICRIQLHKTEQRHGDEVRGMAL